MEMVMKFVLCLTLFITFCRALHDYYFVVDKKDVACSLSWVLYTFLVAACGLYCVISLIMEFRIS